MYTQDSTTPWWLTGGLPRFRFPFLDGGADDEGGDGAGDTDDDEDNSDGEESEEDIKAERDRLRRALAKQKRDNRRLHRKYGVKETDDADDEDDSGADKNGDKNGQATSDKDLRKVRAELDKSKADVEQWRSRALRGEATTALAAAGVKPNLLKRAIRQLDFEDVEFNEDGELEGLEDQIEELKDDLPWMFKSDEDEEEERVRPARRRVTSGARDNGHSASSGKSVTEMQLASLFGGTNRKRR